MLKLESKNAKYVINVPTKESEITKEQLEKLVSNVKLPQYYCIVALRYRVSIFDLVVTAKSNTNKKRSVSVVPLLAKFNEGELRVDAEIGQRVLIDASDIERGSHLNVSTCITPDHITAYVDTDEELRKKAISRQLEGENSSNIFCLEFKIVPASAIKGVIVGKNIDPYFEKVEE